MNDIEVFEYKEFIPGETPKPIVEIEIKGQGMFVCLIDSGADYCTFPIEIGEAIGIDFTNAQRMSTECAHGDVTESYLANLIFTFKGEKFEVLANFVRGGKEPILLGRQSFFNAFEITFDEAEKKVTFKKKKF